MQEDLDIKRKRLAFRAWHRGTKELDLMIGPFADSHLANFDAAMLDDFEALMFLPDPEMTNWLMGRQAPPKEVESPVFKLLLAYCQNRGSGQ